MTKLSNRLLLPQNARNLVGIRGICPRYVIYRQVAACYFLSLPYYKISPKFLFSSDLATNFRIRLYLRSVSDHFTTNSLISCVSTPSCVEKHYPHLQTQHVHMSYFGPSLRFFPRLALSEMAMGKLLVTLTYERFQCDVAFHTPIKHQHNSLLSYIASRWVVGEQCGAPSRPSLRLQGMQSSRSRYSSCAGTQYIT